MHAQPPVLAPSGARRSDFHVGCVDALPVCFTFMFLFFSIGAASSGAGFSGVQAALTTLTVHAAPLQVFIAQHGAGLGLWSLLLATVIINFRFLIMSSVLAEGFRHVPLHKALLTAPLLSVSTFTLANAKKGQVADLHHYYLGCGLVSLGSALLATVLGVWASSGGGAWSSGLIGMILPIHFTALAALSWPQSKPLLITTLGFAATPVAGHYLAEYQIFVMPFVFGAVFLAADKFRERRSA